MKPIYDRAPVERTVRRSNCPCCGELLVHVNIGDGTIDTYCEDCGWPDEYRPPNPACVICGQPGVGECGETWRCEDHWQDAAFDLLGLEKL